MVTAARASDAVAAIVGDGNVRDAAADDAVGGVMPALVVSPADEQQVSEVFTAAATFGLAVTVRGGGTKVGWGAPPRRCDVVLSTARLDGVVEHQPGDLVCVVRGGMRLSALQEVLAAHGQRLALDPCHGVEATIGGIVAANASGPLRTHFGAMRDLVLGARFVLPDGTVGHSGGKVVKNVAGYDVAKLLIGSLGTLAVITEVSLRLHALPRAVRTVAYQYLSAGEADALWRTVERAPVTAAAVVALSPGGAMLVRVEGTEQGARAQADALAGAAGGSPVARVLEEAEADKAWAYAASCVWGGDPVDPVLNVAVPRTGLAALLGHLGALDHVATVLPSLGVAEVRLPRGVAADDVVTLRGWAEQQGGHLTVTRPSPDLAAVAWPAVREGDVAVELMRSVKRAFDPYGMLAPGRFLGGI
jgi:glycolate oxidase FAD binding subunit